jgi:2-oxoglutarate ferredoxin oxidoreductase subunit alpha
MIKDKVEWGRYLDVDGDNIPRRTVAGNQHPKASYFTRGTGHDEYAHYSEEPNDWKNNLDRLKRKYEASRSHLPCPILRNHSKRSEIGIISFGSTDMAVLESVDLLAENNIECDYLRICSIPFSSEVNEFIKAHEKLFVVEANRDGQLKNILSIEFPEYAHRFSSIAKTDGLSLSAEWVSTQITKKIRMEQNA